MRLKRISLRRRPDDRAQSLAEMALILPILLGLVIGIVELGRAWNVRQVITNAAREGARLAVVPTSTEALVQNTIENRLADAGLDPSAATINIDGMDGTVGNDVTVGVSYPHTFLFLGPVVDLMTEDDPGIPGSITLASTAVMRHE